MRADEPCANAVTVDGGVIETSADTGGCWAEFKAAAVTTDDGGMYHCILNKTDAQPVEILQNTFFRSKTRCTATARVLIPAQCSAIL